MHKSKLDFFSSFVTPHRYQLFERIVENRTKYITVVLEDIFQPQNASAVLRTCDCFGIQNVHVIENRNQFNVDTEVALGSSKWIDMYKYTEQENNSLEAIKKLKKQGYRIVATTPHKNDQALPNFDLKKGKTALVFGSELPGISDIIMNEADEFLKIPMFGFTESFNISVSAAIILSELTTKLRNTEGIEWQLSEAEKEDIKIRWIKKNVKSGDLLEKRFLEQNS